MICNLRAYTTQYDDCQVGINETNIDKPLIRPDTEKKNTV